MESRKSPQGFGREWKPMKRAPEHISPLDFEADQSFDPFSVFEVLQKGSQILTVHVVGGRNIHRTWFKCFCFSPGDMPDPYLMLRVPGTPQGYQRTRAVNNTRSPFWNEYFSFVIDPESIGILELILMDANYMLDRVIGYTYLRLSLLPPGLEVSRQIIYCNGSRVFLKIIRTEWFSLMLSEEEKTYLRRRRLRIFKTLKKFLEHRAPPRNQQEVPCVAVLGSGGGFRALAGFAGAVTAMEELGILDCCTYMAGSSGSSWYMSHLYSQEDYPNQPAASYLPQLRTAMTRNWSRVMTPMTMLSYVARVRKKAKGGQPVSFTDFFGQLIGNAILQDRSHTRLTEQRKVVLEGRVPLPIYSCLILRPRATSHASQDWMEFTPYEVGVPRYGLWMKTEHFGSKFYVGHLIKQFKEVPMHYLMGVFGSAYSILFTRILTGLATASDESFVLGTESHVVCPKRTPAPAAPSDTSQLTVIQPYRRQNRDTDDSVLNVVNVQWVKLKARHSTMSQRMDEVQEGEEGEAPQPPSPPPPPTVVVKTPSEESAASGKSRGVDYTSFRSRTALYSVCCYGAREAVSRVIEPREGSEELFYDLSNDSTLVASDFTLTRSKMLTDALWKAKRQSMVDQRQIMVDNNTLWNRLIDHLFTDTNLGTRLGRVASTFSMVRGLNSLRAFPLHPFSTSGAAAGEDAEDEDVEESTRVTSDLNAKTMRLVDSSLAFNLPFPGLLRPQRGVDVLLAFDFSWRPDERASPFLELMLAERWSRRNGLAFPPVQDLCKDLSTQPPRQCYLFQDSADPHCPVVVLFTLLNDRFRTFKAPGVSRTTAEEKAFADFSVFCGPEDYSSFNFTYTAQQFERVRALMAFAVAAHASLLEDVLARAVARKRLLPPRPCVPPPNRLPAMRVALSENAAALLKTYLRERRQVGRAMLPSKDDEDAEERLKGVYYLAVDEGEVEAGAEGENEEERRRPITFEYVLHRYF